MKRFLLFACLLLAITLPASAQNLTAVSGTVTDSGSTPYINGSLTVSFSNTTGQQALFGGNANFQKTYSAALNSTGAFSLSLPSNAIITPSGTQWAFNVCASDGGSCFNALITISGASQDVSATLSSAAPRITFTNLTRFPLGASGQDIQANGTAFSWGNVSSLGANNAFTGANTFTNENDILWVGPGSYATCQAALTAAGSSKVIVNIRSTYVGANCPSDWYLTNPNVIMHDFSAQGPNSQSRTVSYGLQTAGGTNAMIRSVMQVTNIPANGSALSLYNITDLHGGTGGTVLDGGACEADVSNTLTGTQQNAQGCENGVFVTSQGGTIVNARGVFGYVANTPGLGPIFTIANSPSGATESVNTVTITTTTVCTLTTGQNISINGVGVAGYNGDWVVLSPGCNGGSSFTYTNGTAGLGASGSGKAFPATTPITQASGVYAVGCGSTVTSGITGTRPSNCYGLYAPSQAGSASGRQISIAGEGDMLAVFDATVNRSGWQFEDHLHAAHEVLYNDASDVLNLVATSANGIFLEDSAGNGQAVINSSGLRVPTAFLFTETTAPSAAAARDICYGDSTAHAPLCSYNNGSFFKLPTVGITNTWSAAQTFNSGNMILAGATSGTTILNANAAAGSTTATLPANTGILAELNLAQSFTATQTFAAGSGNPDIKVNNAMVAGNAPTCSSTGSTSPTCTVTTGSTNTAGTIQITVGTSPAALGTVTLTFSGNFGTNPPVCLMIPSQLAAGQWNARATIFDKTPAIGSDLQNWDNNGTVLTASTAIDINYHCWAK